MSEAVYPNAPESEILNAPRLSLEVLQEPRPFTRSRLHLDLNALFQAGLLAKFVDPEGVERYQPIGGVE